MYHKSKQFTKTDFCVHDNSRSEKDNFYMGSQGRLSTPILVCITVVSVLTKAFVTIGSSIWCKPNTELPQASKTT